MKGLLTYDKIVSIYSISSIFFTSLRFWKLTNFIEKNIDLSFIASYSIFCPLK